MHGAFAIILVRKGVAEINQQAIAEVLRDKALIACHHANADILE